MTEKHLYTALVGPSFVSTEMSYVNDRIAESDVMGSSVMSTETSYVNGRIAESDVPVEETFEMTERPENKYDEPENNDPANTNYDDVEASENDGTDSEAKVYYFIVK